MVRDKIANLGAYYDSGATRDVSARLRVLRDLRDNIHLMEDEIYAALRSDLGKTQEESLLTEVGMAYGSIRYFLAHGRKLASPRRVRTGIAQIPGKAGILAEPYGKVLVISPWNYPFLLAIDPLIAAVAAGNCVLLKPSEHAPATAAVVEKLVAMTFPKGWVTVIQGDAAVSQAILEEKFDYIFYTGGKKVGEIVLQKAALHLTPVTLELGGKSPVIVCRDADIGVAAKRIVFGKYLNCGQTCVAPDYVFVHEAVHDEFVRSVAEWIERMYGQYTGRIINESHYNRLLSLMEGQNVVYGGKYSAETLSISPAIIDRPDPSSPIMQEEIFGPLLPVLTYSDEKEVLDYIRSGEKPLAAYIFSRDRKHAMELASSFSFGGGCINDTILHLAGSNMPFGGVGESGMGSYHGRYGFDTFTHYKSILDKSTRLDVPLRYPPFSKWKKIILDIVMGM